MRLVKRLEGEPGDPFEGNTLLSAEAMLAKSRELGAGNDAVVRMSDDRLQRSGPSIEWIEDVQ